MSVQALDIANEIAANGIGKRQAEAIGSAIVRSLGANKMAWPRRTISTWSGSGSISFVRICFSQSNAGVTPSLRSSSVASASFSLWNAS